MASDQESLQALEGLMDEFFSPSTTNERKRQIEETLDAFSQQRDAWQHSLFYLSLTQNQFVSMYCMNVLENLINKQWLRLEASDKIHIRDTLTQFLLSHHSQMPSFLRNKMAKLVVDIGRLDWPHFYPDFFTSILQLAGQAETVLLGLVLARTASEELAQPREDLSTARREQLRRLLLQQVPPLLTLLNSLLRSILDKHRSMVTATPPPSPTQGQKLLEHHSPVQPNRLLSSMFKSPHVSTEALPPLDKPALELSLAALGCLAHLFSWIPLSSTLTPSLLDTIFSFAAFGCEAPPERRGSGRCPGGGGEGDQRGVLGVMAMGCVNELLSKHCVPPEFEDFLLQMFLQSFQLLQRITKESTTHAAGNRLAELDPDYVSKFTEFLRLFVSIHLRRFESNRHFAVVDFLALLFKYTFRQASHEGFFACLDIWAVFLDYLSTRLFSRHGTDTKQVLDRYREALEALVSQVLQKVQFRFNQSQLDELDDETLDDDEETEWQHFLRHCLETVAHSAELIPAETFRLVYQPMQEPLALYAGLEQIVSGPPGQRRHLVGLAEHQCRRLHCALRDLSSLLQALGRLSEHFIGERFEENLSDACLLVERLVEIVSYGSRVQLYDVESGATRVLQTDLVEVHAQALATAKAYATWLAQLGSSNGGQAKVMVSALLEATLPLISPGVPEKVTQSAAQLLFSLLTTVRPSYALQMPSVQAFYAHAPKLPEELSAEVRLLVVRSLSHHLLLPPKTADDSQDWASRSAHHAALMAQLMGPFRRLKRDLADGQPLQQEEAVACIRHALKILTDLAETISAEGVSRSKQIFYASIEEDVQAASAIFPRFLSRTDVTEDLLAFFLALFRGLRLQMGAQFTEQTLQTFTSMFSREQLAETLLQHESTAGSQVVDKFLQMLAVIVAEPGPMVKPLVPAILSICLEQIYPIIAERPSPDVKPTLYALLHQLLLHHWRFFFKGSVRKMPDTCETQLPPQEHVEQRPQLEAIMQAFGQSFLQSDIGIFRQNLEALESLNLKWKLYHKWIFRERMADQFMLVLLQTLLVRSHQLLQEEIGLTLYNMAAVNFDHFYAHFLPHFLQSCESLDSSQKAALAANFPADKDLPSFTQSIHRLVNDLRYYQLCNSSLPQGSVTF